jgi:DNA polymerase-3 subunit gamma/tau
VDEIVANLNTLVKAEKLQADQDALTLIARQASGSIRDAQSLLDQLSSTGNKVTLSLAQTVLGTATSQTVLEVINAVRGREPAAGLEAIHRALDAGVDPRSLARQLVEYLRGLMLIQMGNEGQVEAAVDVKKQMQTHAGAFTHPEVLRMVKAFNAAATDLRGGWQPSLGLELAVAELIEAPGPALAKNNPPNSPANRTVENNSGQATVKSRDQERSAPGLVIQEPTGTFDKTPAKEKKETDQGNSKSSGSATTTTEIIRSWKQICAEIKEVQPNTTALLNSVRTIEVHGNVLVLGLASQVLVEKMEKAEHIEMTRSKVNSIAHADLEIRCVVTTSKGKLPPNIQQDGMVATALNQGGEIIDLDE